MWCVLNVYVIAHINITVRVCVWCMRVLCMCVHFGHWMTQIIACSAPRGFHSSDAQRKSICLELKARKTSEHKHSFGSSQQSEKKVHDRNMNFFIGLYERRQSGGTALQPATRGPSGWFGLQFRSSHASPLYLQCRRKFPKKPWYICSCWDGAWSLKQCLKNRKSDSDWWWADFQKCLF